MSDEADRLLPARTFGEAMLYLRVRGAAPLSARRREERGRVLLEVRALHDGAERRFAFRLPSFDDADDLHLGGGAASELLDAADLVLFAARVEREAPDPATLDANARATAERDLELAAEAALEATKFVPPGEDGVPEEAIRSAAGRWLHRKDPARFSRDALLDLETRLRAQVAAIRAHHALDPG